MVRRRATTHTNQWKAQLCGSRRWFDRCYVKCVCGVCAPWWSGVEVGGESSWFRGCKWDGIVFLAGGWSCLACLALHCLLPEVGGPTAYGCDATHARGMKTRRGSQNQFVSLRKCAFKNKSFLHLWLTATFPPRIWSPPPPLPVCAYPLLH